MRHRRLKTESPPDPRNKSWGTRGKYYNECAFLTVDHSRLTPDHVDDRYDSTLPLAVLIQSRGSDGHPSTVSIPADEIDGLCEALQAAKQRVVSAQQTLTELIADHGSAPFDGDKLATLTSYEQDKYWKAVKSRSRAL